MDNSLETPKNFKKQILASIYEEQESMIDSTEFEIDEKVDEKPIDAKL